jgi:ABC-type Mn2+/Zn2+ transport system permease subunit
VIASFLSSWALFHDTYLTGWALAVALSLVGILVVARDQIFIGVAISQASTLGIALAIWLPGVWAADSASWLRSDLFAISSAVLFSVAAALLTSRGGGLGRESHEAITGWVFLISASLSILVLAHSPHGLEEIHRLVSSSIIGATHVDVWVFVGLAAVGGLAVGLTQRRLLLFATDPAMAGAVGMRVGRWSLLTSLSLGLVVALSIRSSGLIYTFGCLVLPALIAKNLCREMRPIFLMAPAIALASGVLGFGIANHYDYPPAQLTVALLAVLLVLVWSCRWVLGLVAPRSVSSDRAGNERQA